MRRGEASLSIGRLVIEGRRLSPGQARQLVERLAREMGAAPGLEPRRIDRLAVQAPEGASPEMLARAVAAALRRQAG